MLAIFRKKQKNQGRGRYNESRPHLSVCLEGDSFIIDHYQKREIGRDERTTLHSALRNSAPRRMEEENRRVEGPGQVVRGETAPAEGTPKRWESKKRMTVSSKTKSKGHRQFSAKRGRVRDRLEIKILPLKSTVRP